MKEDICQSRCFASAPTAEKAAVEPEPTVFALAEACFEQSINTAKRQSAKSWELRAMMSLARLHQKQSKAQEARRQLAEIYDSFTEGFDTVDSCEAKALLDELAL